MQSSSSSAQTPQKKRSEPGQNIQVYVRVRPLSQDEKSSRSWSIVSCPANHRDVSVQTKLSTVASTTFNFDRVFDDRSQQADVYKSVVSPLIKQVLRGYNCTVFAYGQTGTGKTYTMEGLKDFDGSWEDDPDAGIIPRSLVDIFEARKKGGFDGDSFQIKVSFLELYNEEIFDLLSKDRDFGERKHKIFEDSSKKGSVIVQGLEEIVVKSKEAVLKILEEGSTKRQTAATKMNATSSRSHTIFTITVTITEKTMVGQERFIEGKLNLVDLAGSENIGRSGAVDKRAREAGKINESLLTLGRVINSLVKRETHIPYRESKLTRLLQDSLGGRTKTSIVATISPASINQDETLSTLDYAHRAKNITNRPEVNQKISVASKMAEIQHKFESLQKELADQRDRDGGVFISQEKKDEMERKMAELQQLRKEFKDLSTLFDLKSAENVKLSENLDETIRQLEEKNAVLQKTQEEKEVQEHLVSRHTDTESKLTEQALELREVADQQYSDIQKLQDSKRRKSEVASHNEKAGSAFQSVSSARRTREDSIESARADARARLLSALRRQREAAAAAADEFTREAVDEAAEADARTRRAMTELEALDAEHLHSMQKAVSKELKEAQERKDQAIFRSQNHLTKTLSVLGDLDSDAEKMSQSAEAMAGAHAQLVSEVRSDHVTAMKRREELYAAADKAQEEHFNRKEQLRSEQLDLLKKQDSELASLEEERKLVEETIRLQQRLLQSLDKKIQDLKERNAEISAKNPAFGAEDGEARKASAASHRELKALDLKEVDKLEETHTKSIGDCSDHHETHRSTLSHQRSSVASCREEETASAEKEQEEERATFERAERDKRQALEEVAKQVEARRNIERTEQKKSAESLSRRVGRIEAHAADDAGFRAEAEESAETFAQEAAALDAKMRREKDEERRAEKGFFDRDLKRYEATGATPAREKTDARTYPKDIVRGTPDEERVRRYRQSRDLGAAMRLRIQGGSDDDEDDDNTSGAADTAGSESDSVISASTRVTTSEAAASNRGRTVRARAANKTATAAPARKNSDKSVSAALPPSSNASLESEEVGYGSDRENREPPSSSSKATFAKPNLAGSKLQAPKVYPASSSSGNGGVAIRSRSSSRSRNALGSAN